MTETEYYELIRQKLKLGPLYAPKHKKVEELMRIFWTEDEAKLLSQFNSCDTPTSLNELEERTGLSKKEIKEKLSAPYKKRTITKVGAKYTLLPLVPGIFEQYYIYRQDNEENLKKAAEIYRFLFKTFLLSLNIETDFKLFRPRLPLDAKEKLIEVNKEFDVKHQVLSFELIDELLNKYDTFATVPCQCRLIGEYTGDPCKLAPALLGCFLAGGVAVAAIQGGATGMNKEQAIEFLKKTEKAGLVHNCVADSSGESSLFVCNCCSCHCGALISAKEHKKVSVYPSNYIPKFNNELCTKCELCLKKCPMGAIFHHFPSEENKSDEHMFLHQEYCLGCGVCSANCPNKAITLIKVKDNEFKEKHKIGNKTFLDLLM